MTDASILALNDTRFILEYEYPGSKPKGTIITESFSSAIDHPHLFRRMQWFEQRTFDQLLSIKFIKVTTYVGYFRENDIVPVEAYSMDLNNPEPKFLGFYLGKKSNDFHPVECVAPSTEALYKKFKLRV